MLLTSFFRFLRMPLFFIICSLTRLEFLSNLVGRVVMVWQSREYFSFCSGEIRGGIYFLILFSQVGLAIEIR